jgi:nitric oxide reductase subunit C
MTKRQTRFFFFAGTLVFTLVFIALTIDSHRQFDRLTNADQITSAVIEGKHVWHRKNCINCHTLLGEGAYYAPDLTRITTQRGAAYLQQFLKDPSKFYSEERDRRLMPNQNLSDADITNLIAFLDWVSRIDNQGWPPRPILVSGETIPGSNIGGQAPAAPPSGDPVAQGQALFRASPPSCSGCHSVAAGVNLAAPTLAGLATRAEQTIHSPEYKGEATDAPGYIRESILHVNAYIVPGDKYSANGQSFMPANFEQSLTAEQIDQLVAYLMTLK